MIYLGHFRSAVVEGIADRAAIETSRKLLAALTNEIVSRSGVRTLIAASQRFRDVNKGGGQRLAWPPAALPRYSSSARASSRICSGGQSH